MSKLVKSLGALGAIILILLAAVVLRSLRQARAEAPDQMPSSYVRALGHTPGWGSAAGLPALADPAALLAIKGVKTVGALSPAAVRKTLAADLPKLADCCQDAARNAVPLPRKITLVFEVGPDGRLTGVPFGKPPLASQEFESLMAGALRDLQFPAFHGAPVQVEVTLALAG